MHGQDLGRQDRVRERGPLRVGAARDPRFVAPRSTHPGALWLAAAAPLAATLLLLAARISG
ncbi:hypothetical protein [Methylobacterium gregans]|uniref:hypothetical protein n=1 Tax=Methylobacterium gregans TaxID=374424 RepID=UPI0036149E5D